VDLAELIELGGEFRDGLLFSGGRKIILGFNRGSRVPCHAPESSQRLSDLVSSSSEFRSHALGPLKMAISAIRSIMVLSPLVRFIEKPHKTRHRFRCGRLEDVFDIDGWITADAFQRSLRRRCLNRIQDQPVDTITGSFPINGSEGHSAFETIKPL